MYNYNLKGLHILVCPNFPAEEFLSIPPRLHCQEVILFLPEGIDPESWKKVIEEQLRLAMKCFIYSKVDFKGFDHLYDIGSYISARNVFLCKNSDDPLILNIIHQNTTINLVSEFSTQEYLTLVQYSREKDSIYVMPVFPYWKENCRLLFELLSKINQEKTKKELLEEILTLNPDFTSHQLEEALIQLEKSMISYQGFSKGRKGHANTYWLEPIIKI